MVVRTTRMPAEPTDDFWWGCQNLFGTDVTDVYALEPLNDLLNGLSNLPVPSVIRKGSLDGKAFVVVEKMPGQTLTSFSTLLPQAMEQLGTSIASIHAKKFDTCGTPSGRVSYPIAAFHERLTVTLRGIVERFYSEDSQVVGMLDEMCLAAAKLPALDYGSLIMMDMDPTQFLTDGRQITALVDTEVYCIGPRALDLVALEYLLEDDAAQAFQRGYKKVLALPDLAPMRPVYRYLNRLLRVQGTVDNYAWMNWPERFS